MKNLRNFKQYLWILPVLGIILNILSLIIPIFYDLTSREVFWILGFKSSNIDGLKMISNEFLLLFSFITSFIIIVFSYGLFKNAYLIYQRKEELKIIKYWLAWILIGIFSILLIYFYISFDFWDRFDFKWDFWDSYQFSGAMVLLFISGSWMIVSGVLLKLLDYYNFL
ncbi:MAG: membrane protein of unknown function [Promethearchaeota archaeon]|nr:MAG: membrane protein of unknown function [Candidatus Lokiarchaeota archaeon]